ncbi:hypothetical protein [Flavobacterium pectinovorum]|uniref:Uncharacterized protein n=1 Tax=Flavobacterium pectinovorum TaxID=29533 RepID=A0A502F2E9_9FLAO|nr:hypothetical protein [Flavobacterium pectinovorum]TPG44007.1 hypothetical protein EAH81_05510 [Flavobacterium pectinovorum]
MKLKLLFVLLILFASCKNSSNYETNSEDENSTEYVNDENTNYEVADDESEDENLSETKNYDDGSYNASVDYYNPKTGYSATYDLDVDVENGEVVRINFPKGGWLDDDVHPSESQISPAELNEEGEATMEDENGRTFEIKIDN